MSILSVKIHSLITITKIFVFINIILMYFYLPAWWNGAVGQIQFVIALASILLLRTNFKVKNLLLYVFSFFGVLASGWPYSVIAYFIVIFLYFIEILYDKEYKKVIIFFYFYRNQFNMFKYIF